MLSSRTCARLTVLVLSIEMMLRADESNISRLEFLIVVQQWADTEPVIQTWLNAQALEVLKTLRAPAAAESNALLDAAKRYGGVSCLRDVFVFFSIQGLFYRSHYYVECYRNCY